MSINYIDINSRAMNLIMSVKKHTQSIKPDLKALVELRVSQINGCSYCIDLHSHEARTEGVSQQRIDCVIVSGECGLFSEAEIAALSWAETVTNISIEHQIEEKLEQLLKHFSEVEAVDLTIIISVMNSMNRMAISFGDKPTLRN